jgi:hypothetical protein
MKRKPQSKLLAVARQMPALQHTIQGRPFRLEESPALNWLLAQPDLRNWLFRQLVAKKLIAFDAATQTWRGADACNPHAQEIG